MTTRLFGLNRFVAAVGAVVITAVSTWAFVDSTASPDRDPFHFAAVMSANANAHAQVLIAQAQSNTVSECPKEPKFQEQLPRACLSG